MSILIFFLILSLLVIIHELGHFIAAKSQGVMVEEFGFGLPPRLFGVKFGETIYSLNWLPFGGFVKVLGEEAAELSEKKLPHHLINRAFVNRSHFSKISILTAGVIMNVILAVTIYYALLAPYGFKSDPVVLLGDYHFRFGREIGSVIIAGVSPHTPAAKTALEQGDVVENIISQKFNSEKIVSADSLIKHIGAAADKPVTIQVKNVYDDTIKTVTVTPVYSQELKRYIIGVQLADGVIIDYSQTPLLSGPMHSYNMAAYNFSSLGQLVKISLKKKQIAPLSQSVSGPVGIFGLVDQIIKTSGKKVVYNLLNFVALLSVSLATINILPFPALDGGRVTVVLYEWIRGRRVNANFERRLNLAGFAILLTLIALVTINDIVRVIFK